jgi:hypothetical protein
MKPWEEGAPPPTPTSHLTVDCLQAPPSLITYITYISDAHKTENLQLQESFIFEVSQKAKLFQEIDRSSQLKPVVEEEEKVRPSLLCTQRLPSIAQSAI